MKKSLWVILTAVVLSSLGMIANASTLELPDFIPEYYSPAFTVNDVVLNMMAHSTTNGVEQWQYGSEDKSLWLAVEFANCDSSQTQTVFKNLLGYLNAQAKEYGGNFNVVEKNNAYAVITEPKVDRHVFAYRVQNGIQIWTYSTSQNSSFPVDQFESVKFLVNRQRYADAYKKGNVAMGKWGDAVYNYASELLRAGKKQEAIKVLRRVISSSPYNYNAHLDFIKNTADLSAATNSAKIVADNSEDVEQIRQAEVFLGITPPSMEELPYLEQGEKGLQVILVALPPCNIQLLEEASVVYQSITDIPVKVCRLKEKWKWLTPERFGNQRAVERLLVQVKGEKIDFSEWSERKYIEELRAAGTDAGALYTHYIDELIEGIENEPGQYRVDQYVDKFCRILEGYCTSDKRTMYIGVTENNIYSDNNNYLFSQGRIRGKSLASVLSYHMMQAQVLKEDYAFRPRLTERLAKEMVPASLKQLGIPRSTDPRCPYSYSSGVSRLDEKTLTLAEPVKNALLSLRENPLQNK